MKRNLLSVLFIGFISIVSSAQQDTIIGWNFPSDTVTTTNAEFGLTGNLGYDLKAEDSNYNQRAIQMKNGSGGSGDYAAQAVGWDNGANDKDWSIKFKADGYSDFKVSAVMTSGGSNPGPKYWKVQAKLSSGSWEDISDTVTIANNWTTGLMSELPLPASYNHPGSTSIYVRWISITNENINGGTVDSTGVVKIDNILITATNTSGKEDIVYDNSLHIYPNPVKDRLFISSEQTITQIQILNITGQVVESIMPSNQTSIINLSDVEKGIYFVKIIYTDTYLYRVERIIIQ